MLAQDAFELGLSRLDGVLVVHAREVGFVTQQFELLRERSHFLKRRTIGVKHRALPTRQRRYLLDRVLVLTVHRHDDFVVKLPTA